MRIILVLLIAGLITNSFAQEIPTPVKAKLVSNIDSAHSINLGVLFDIDPGWHIYWKYPGDAGLPTKITFNLPEGYQASETLWPVPSGFKKNGGGVDFGYEDSVLIWTNIKFPTGVKIENLPNFETQVSWISCKEICIPGNAKLMLATNLINNNSESSSLFSNWSDKLPISFADEKNPFDIQVQKIFTDDGVNIKLRLSSILENKNIEFYPNPGDSLLIENMRSIKTIDNKTQEIGFKVKAKNGVILARNVFDGLIVYSDKQDNRSAVELKIDLNDI